MSLCWESQQDCFLAKGNGRPYGDEAIWSASKFIRKYRNLSSKNSSSWKHSSNQRQSTRLFSLFHLVSPTDFPCLSSYLLQNRSMDFWISDKSVAESKHDPARVSTFQSFHSLRVFSFNELSLWTERGIDVAPWDLNHSPFVWTR